MSKEEMLETFLNVEPADRIVMLILVSFHLTIVSRDIFLSQSNDKKLKSATGIQEINHKITSNVIDRLKGNNSRYPDNVLIEILFETFAAYELNDYLSDVWNSSAWKARAQ